MLASGMIPEGVIRKAVCQCASSACSRVHWDLLAFMDIPLLLSFLCLLQLGCAVLFSCMHGNVRVRVRQAPAAGLGSVSRLRISVTIFVAI